jgi:hypothetical protein
MAIRALKDDGTRKWLLNGIGKLLRYEVQKLCSDKVNSIQRSDSKEGLLNFSFHAIMEEALEYCPTLFTLLHECTRTKKDHPNQMHIVGVIICIICKYRCSSMSLFQRLISSLLHAEHVGTKVCAQVQCTYMYVYTTLFFRHMIVFRK